ncbi:uncharacterized protein CLUP02_00512 [Colletotrichum lupini]|uniref:FAR1 domain-containing protein n=1 Tax=Colletotrichum lupini TaxID=145971 RepID=A0A9Q8W915_9PEZI|nr:uncharacterized protein CLUP02_00512 [Colletotrichum lupini]UQC73865.1 hypothetical protein CLUP02_00512 [Colletotrichum lupini]
MDLTTQFLPFCISLKLPPMDLTDNSIDDLFARVRLHQRDLGYGVNKLKSRKRQDGSLLRLDLACERGGRPRPSVAKQRQTTTSKTGCPWRARIHQCPNPQDGYRVSVICSEHNHESLATESYSSSRVFRELSRQEPGTEAVSMRVESLSATGRLTSAHMRTAIPHPHEGYPAPILGLFKQIMGCT